AVRRAVVTTPRDLFLTWPGAMASCRGKLIGRESIEAIRHPHDSTIPHPSHRTWLVPNGAFNVQRPTPNERGEDRPDVRESIAAYWALGVESLSERQKF